MKFPTTWLLERTPEEDLARAQLILASQEYWTLPELIESSLSPWLVREFAFGELLRFGLGDKLAAQLACWAVSEIRREHMDLGLLGRAPGVDRTLMLGRAGVYAAKAVALLDEGITLGCRGDYARYVIANAALALAHAAAAEHPVGALAGNDDVAREHLREMARRIAAG